MLITNGICVSSDVKSSAGSSGSRRRHGAVGARSRSGATASRVRGRASLPSASALHGRQAVSLADLRRDVLAVR